LPQSRVTEPFRKGKETPVVEHKGFVERVGVF
jgi:hypothetical protein